MNNHALLPVMLLAPFLFSGLGCDGFDRKLTKQVRETVECPQSRVIAGRVVLETGTQRWSSVLVALRPEESVKDLRAYLLSNGVSLFEYGRYLVHGMECKVVAGQEVLSLQLVDQNPQRPVGGRRHLQEFYWGVKIEYNLAGK